MFSRIINNTKKHLSGNIIFYCIFIILFILPFFWFSQDLYLLGEDDTGLLYYNPEGTSGQFMSSWCCGDELAKIQMPGGSLIFTSVLRIFKFISFGQLNPQLLVLSFIISFSFLFIVKFLELFNENSKSYGYYIAGLFYALSSYFVVVEYYYLMPSTLIIVLAPILTYYLFKAIKENSNKPLFIGAIWSLIFSRSLMTPVFINFFALLFLFVLIHNYFNYGFKKIKNGLLSFFKFVIFIIAINALIFIPFFSTSFFTTESTVSSAYNDKAKNVDSMIESFKTEYETGGIQLKKMQDIFINLYPKDLNHTRGWRNQDLYEKYYNQTSPLMYIIVLLTFLGLVIFPKKKRKKILPMLILFVLTLLFLSVGVIEVFTKFYIYLMTHLPIFNMNRYPSMRFDVPFVFYYSLIVGTCLYYLFKRINKKLAIICFFGCLLVLVIVNYSFITGKVFTEKLEPTDTVRAMDFNNDYKKLTDDIPQYIRDDAKLLLFPMGYGFGSFIAGQDDSQYYRSQITGFKSFTGYEMMGCVKNLSTTLDDSIFTEANEYYFKNNINSLYSLAKKLNFKYIVYSKDTDKLKKYKELVPELTYENKTYYDPIDYKNPVYENDGYSLYKINNYDDISKFTSNDNETEIYFNKVSDFMYLMKIKTFGSDTIKMHEGFSKSWQLLKLDKDDFDCKNPLNFAKSFPNIYECEHSNNNLSGNIKFLGMFNLKKQDLPHIKADNYYNKWEIDTDGGYEYYAIILDEQRSYIVGGIVSIIIFFLYIYLIFKKPKIEKKKKLLNFLYNHD